MQPIEQNSPQLKKSNVPLSEINEQIHWYSHKNTGINNGCFSQDFSIFTLNNQMDLANVPYGLNEDKILEVLSVLEYIGDETTPEYWLMVCRISEMALLCAGQYADGCEFSAAGDLLVNPRNT